MFRNVFTFTLKSSNKSELKEFKKPLNKINVLSFNCKHIYYTYFITPSVAVVLLISWVCGRISFNELIFCHSLSFTHTHTNTHTHTHKRKSDKPSP